MRFSLTCAVLLITCTLFISGCQPSLVNGNTIQSLNVTLTDEGCPAIQARVAAGSTFRVKLTNQGQESQQVRLMVYPQSAGIDPQDEKNVYWQVRVQPGFSLIEDVTAPQMPGEYEIVCGPGTQADLPVTGTLTVIQSQN